MLWPSGWIWVAGAAVNGWVTNWLALTLNFRPLAPVKVLGVTLQGDFLRRQPEVAERWADYVAQHVLTLDTIARYMVYGRYGDRTQAIISRHVKPILDEAGVIRWTMQVAVGTTGYVELKEAVRHKAVDLAEEPFRDKPFREATAQRISERLSRLLRSLPPEAFQRILLPAFQSEQWLLMLAGALAGTVVGGLQAWII
ncbi:hypothetical protein AAIA72_02840 [Hahella sp. SMD15-11]|uniref:DUF445 family protein n=1 Tax=Thermohahella caldifontis TaxID=3142973 RepID=A0AB39UXD4_9GAMM